MKNDIKYPEHISSIAATSYCELCERIIDSAYQLQRYIANNIQGAGGELLEQTAREKVQQLLRMRDIMDEKYIKPLLDQIDTNGTI